MAKLTPIKFYSFSGTGEKYEFKADVTVGPDGTFAVKLPPDLLETATRLLTTKEWSKKGVDIYASRFNTPQMIRSKTLQNCKDYIQAVIDDHLKCDTKIELVIAYGTEIAVSYCKTPSGKIYPNKVDHENAEWLGSLHGANYDKYFRICFAAEVVQKTTHTRASGKKIVYENIHACDASKIAYGKEDAEAWNTSWAGKLNSFTGLSVCDSHAKLAEGMKEMPYSEDAAKFFYEVMIGMCALADRLGNFFDNEKLLLHAIQNKIKLLGGKDG